MLGQPWTGETNWQTSKPFLLDASGIKPFYSLVPYCLWNSHALMLYWYGCNPWTFKYDQVQTQKRPGNLADFTCFRNHIVAHNFKQLVKPIINDSPHLLILCVIKDKQQSTLLLHLLTQCVFALGSDASNGTLSYHIHAGIAHEFLHRFLSFTACFLHTCSNIQLLRYSLNFFSGTKNKQKLWNALFLMWNTHEPLWSSSRWW